MIVVGEGQTVCEICGVPMPSEMPKCTARCDKAPHFGPQVGEPIAGLSDYSDEEIAREYQWRMMKKLGDPRICVSGSHR